MKSREAAVAREESASGARHHLTSEKTDPLLARYLGTALQTTLAKKRRAADATPRQRATGGRKD